MEDDPASQLLVRKALAHLGEVEVIDNGRTALERVLADPPHLLLLDLNLPELNGEALLALLRQAPATRALPVIVLSAASEAAAGIACQARLVKPLDLDELRRQVHACLAGVEFAPT